MCTRYFTAMIKELAPLIEAAISSRLTEQIRTRLGKDTSFLGEIRPSDVAAVIAPDRNGERGVFPMVWGFSVNGLAAPVVNARVETAAEKPSFRDSWLNRRCIIPAVSFYEWQHYRTSDGKMKTGEKYSIKPVDSAVTYIAGLYRYEEKEGFRYPVFTVLTTEPTEKMRELHDRMPLILPESAINDWIRPGGDPFWVTKLALTDLLIERTDDQQTFF